MHTREDRYRMKQPLHVIFRKATTYWQRVQSRTIVAFNMSHLKAVHWLAPTTIILALLMGVLLALGHHIFYAELHGKAVPIGYYALAGKQLPEQQFNTSVGIALAFLVKMFLSIALSTIYVQFFWRSIKGTNKRPTITELDWAYSGIENVLNLFNLKIGWKYPFLVFIALIFWCIPIATIFPPATLSVENAHEILSSMLQVPQFDFATLNYVAPISAITGDNNTSTFVWNGPSQSVQHIALAVMGLGQIIPISAPASNATWSLDFWGPALQCHDVDKTDRDRTWINIWNALDQSNPDFYAFLSWVPWSDGEEILNGLPDDGIPDFQPANNNLPFLFNYTSDAPVVGPQTAFLPTNGSASFFIATFPEVTDFKGVLYPVTGPGCEIQMMHEITDPGTNCSGGTAAQYYVNSTLLRCDMVNTSYSVDFNYSGGAQNIHVSSNMTGNSTLINSTGYFLGPPQWDTYPDLSLLPANCSTFSALPGYGDPRFGPCVFDLDSIRQLSYQGIMAAFNQLVLGFIQSQDGFVDNRTSIIRTVLATTKELTFLQSWGRFDDSDNDFLTIISNSTGWAYTGLGNSNPSDSEFHLKSTLERLFQNFTISLLADPYLQPNYSSPFAPQRLTNVSLPTYHNIYTYDRETLWIAYGLSIFFTTLAAIAGIIVLLLNGASYSNNFSTIIRVARTADLSTDVLDKEHDGFGRDPLPKHLKDARLNLTGGADGVAATTTGGSNTDADRSVELMERRRVEEDEQSLIVTQEMNRSHQSISTEELQSSFTSRRSFGSQSHIASREIGRSHGSISPEELPSPFISRRSVESVD